MEFTQVYWEGALARLRGGEILLCWRWAFRPPFPPTSIKTHFARVYIIVRECTPESSHVGGVVSKNKIPSLDPPLPATPNFRRDQTFRKRLLNLDLIVRKEDTFSK